MLTENFKIVPIAAALDLNGTSPVACDSINMKGYHKATFIFITGTLGGASAVLTFTSGATNGAQTSVVDFNYAWAGTAYTGATADVLNALTFVAGATGVTLTHGTYDLWMLVCEIDAACMDIANGENWLTAIFTDPGGATGLVSGVAILEPRYGNAQSVTALS